MLGNGRWENREGFPFLMACKLGNYQLIAGLTTLLNSSCGLLIFLGHLEFKVVSLNSLAVSHVCKKCVSASWHLSLVSLPVNQLWWRHSSCCSLQHQLFPYSSRDLHSGENGFSDLTRKSFNMRQYEAELGFMRDTSVQMSSKALRNTETPGAEHIYGGGVSKRLPSFIVS